MEIYSLQFMWPTRRALSRLVGRVDFTYKGVRASSSLKSHTNLLDLSEASSSFIKEDLKIIPNFVTEEEHDQLVDEIKLGLRRKRYQGGHWDEVIHDFREVEKPSWGPMNAQVIERARAAILSVIKERERDQIGEDYKPMDSNLLEWLPPHVLDLAPTGYIKPHVDSIKFSGDTVASLSLLSTRVGVLRRDYWDGAYPSSAETVVADVDSSSSSSKPPRWGVMSTTTAGGSAVEPPACTVRFLLPPRTLYIMTGSVRYLYAHAILGSSPDAMGDDGGWSSVSAPFSSSSSSSSSAASSDGSSSDGSSSPCSSHNGVFWRDEGGGGAVSHVPVDRRMSIMFRDAK